MRKILDWFHGWAITLDIKFRHPELYQHLTRAYDPDAYVEADRPE